MGGYGQALVGGMLIGLASVLLYIGLGRIAGISGISSEALMGAPGSGWRWAFLTGLVLGGAVFAHGLGIGPMVLRSPVLLIAAGLLVGWGTVYGSGCTSGHGVCGLARGSLRSLVAVLTFMGSGALTVYITRHVLL